MLGSLEALRGYRIAHEQGKKFRVVSPWSFHEWKDAGCTHVCFDCGPSPIGYREVGGVLVGTREVHALYLQDHDDSHAVIGNLQNYESGGAWLEAEIPENFPFLIAGPEH